MTFSVHSCFLIFVASSRTSCRSECRWDLNWWEMSIIQCLTALFYSWIKNTHQFHLPVPSSHHDLDMGCPFVSPTSPLVISWFQVWKVFSPADRSRRFESMIFCNLNFFCENLSHDLNEEIFIHAENYGKQFFKRDFYGWKCKIVFVEARVFEPFVWLDAVIKDEKSQDNCFLGPVLNTCFKFV